MGRIDLDALLGPIPLFPSGEAQQFNSPLFSMGYGGGQVQHCVGLLHLRFG